MHTQVLNHPQKGDVIKVEPLRSEADIQRVVQHLADHPRNLCIFLLGINVNLRASDLLKVKVGQVRYLRPGDSFNLREKKTSKTKQITLNRLVIMSIQNLLGTMPLASDEDLLFQSRKMGGKLTVPTLNNMVKKWTGELGIKGNFGAHSLRKTFGYIHRTVFGTDIPTLMLMFNHATQRQTLEYLCIQQSEVQDAYLREIGNFTFPVDSEGNRQYNELHEPGANE